MNRRPPLVPVALGAVAILFLLVPMIALILRAPWDEVGTLIASPKVLAALRVSLTVSLAALAVAIALGVPLAWLLARHDFPGRRLVRALATVPMVLPPVVAGVALLVAFGRRGLVGAPLERLTGITIPFTTWAAVLAAAFVAMPFLVTSVEAGLAAVDGRLEEAAETLGAGRWFTFRHVTLPAIGPALGAGVAMTWARALGEFGATITFAGNVPEVSQTMPLAVVLQLQTDPEAAYLLALMLLVVSLTVLVLSRSWAKSL